MQTLDRVVPSNFDLVCMGDTHEGSLLQHQDGIRECLEYVMAKANRFMVHMGDEVEAIATDDPRFDPETEHDVVPLKQRDSVIACFKPVRKRIVTWLLGNHPHKLHRFGNITADICHALEVPYGTWTARVSFRDKHGLLFKGFFAHGIRGRITSNAKDWDQRQANMKATLKQRLKEKAGDCLVMAVAHTHLLLVASPAPMLYLTDDGERVKQHYLQPGAGTEEYIHPDQRWYANTGSFLRTYGSGISSYAEIAGYDPVELGYVVVHVKDRKVVGVEKRVL